MTATGRVVLRRKNVTCAPISGEKKLSFEIGVTRKFFQKNKGEKRNENFGI